MGASGLFRVALGAALLAAIGCVRAVEFAEGVDVVLSFEPEPRVGQTTCTIRLRDEAGAPLSGADLELEGNMNHAGMVPVFGDARELGNGIYEAPLTFTMGGDWFVIVRGTLADGRELEELRDVPGVESGELAGDGDACCTEARAKASAASAH